LKEEEKNWNFTLKLIEKQFYSLSSTVLKNLGSTNAASGQIQFEIL